MSKKLIVAYGKLSLADLMNKSHSRLLDYCRTEYCPVRLMVYGENLETTQLRRCLKFSDNICDTVNPVDESGDFLILLQEWNIPSEEYDDILQRWPYPKESHLFPKGWAEARRICISIFSDDRPHILYINRDAYTDRLVIAMVEI